MLYYHKGRDSVIVIGRQDRVHARKMMTAIYQEYFGFKEPPFSLAPDPRFLYSSEPHKESMAHLVYGVRGEGGFVLLTGEIGAGKTTVFRSLLEHLPEEVKIAFVIHPRLTVEELLATICDEFGITYPDRAGGTKVYVDLINRYLLDITEKGCRAVLAIDEAQSLRPEILEQLRLLTNLETHRRKLLQVILLGQPELRETLSSPEMRQLTQRIAARYHLGPLPRKDVAPYIAHRLEVAGGQSCVIPSSLSGEIYRFSGGVPRLINILCDRALLGVFSRGYEKVDKSILRQASREVSGAAPRKLRPAFAAAALMALLLALFLAAGNIVRMNPLNDQGEPSLSGTEAVAAPETASVQGSLDLAADAIPERGIDWLMSQSLSGSRETALAGLFRTWGIDIEPGERRSDPCQLKEWGVRCLSGEGNLSMLGNIDRPAVLRLPGADGQEFYALLRTLEGENATLLFESGSGQVQLRWFGEYILLWRPPPAYRRAVVPGQRGPVVQAVRELLSMASAPGTESTDAEFYDDLMVEAVRGFQRTRDLEPDGIIGPMTLIHLNTSAGVDVPRLTAEEGGDERVHYP